MRLILFLVLLTGGAWAACTTKARTTAATTTGATQSTVTGTSGTSTAGVPSTGVSSTVSSSTIPESNPGSGGEAGAEGATSTTEDCTYDDTTPGVVGTTPQQPGTTTVQQTTLPQVNVSYVQFQFGSCVNGKCSYTYIAPMNDQSVLQADQANITYDQSLYQVDYQTVQSFNASITTVIGPAQTKVEDLRTQLGIAQQQLADMQTQLNQIIANTNNATNALTVANLYISKIDKSNSCFYSCTLPPTQPPTTTPTTAVPTTTEGPCESGKFNCTMEDSWCVYDNQHVPYCTGCTGNMDGYEHCEWSTCSAQGYDATVGVFWSPGYNATDDNGQMDSGQSCLWTYEAVQGKMYKFNTALGSYNFSSLGTDGTDNGNKPIVFLIPTDTSLSPYNIDGNAKVKSLNNFLTNSHISSFTITLTTPDSPTPDQAFFWEFVSADTPTASAFSWNFESE